MLPKSLGGTDMIVKVKEAGLKLAGKWHFINEIVEISSEEYKDNKEYVEVIEESKLNSKKKVSECNDNARTNKKNDYNRCSKHVD